MANTAPAQPFLSPDQQTDLHRIAQGMSREQLIWASGFLAGAASSGAAAPAIEAQSAPAVTVLYASQTGNGRRVAEQLAAGLEARGAVVNLAAMAEYRRNQLTRETQLVAVISTHGEGDPPDAAMGFFKFLSGPRAPGLDGLRYAVLALGDSSYEHYCKAGRDFDERLAELGAQRLCDRVDCDVEFQAAAKAWAERVLETVEIKPASAPSNVIVMPSRADGRVNAASHDIDRPFAADVLEVQAITGRGSASKTTHLELSLGGSGLSYLPGDALGVYPVNPAAVVDPLLNALGLQGGEEVVIDDQRGSLQEALTTQLEATQLTTAAFSRWSDEAAAWFKAQEPQRRRELLQSWQWIDVVQRFPRGDLVPQDLVTALGLIKPRLYSIASSPALVEDEVHLTVARLAYDIDGAPRYGAASHYLEALQPGEQARVYVEPNAGFRLPDDPATPIIMVGAGTGVAPFRAFVDERVTTGASGDNWLIFGHRHLRSDFLYQIEWLRHLKAGGLSRLDVAFSRDQEERRYVQHVVAANRDAVIGQLKDGAHLYVCGSVAMGEAVQQTLIDAGGVDLVDQLQDQSRLHKDLY